MDDDAILDSEVAVANGNTQKEVIRRDVNPPTGRVFVPIAAGDPCLEPDVVPNAELVGPVDHVLQQLVPTREVARPWMP